MKKAVRILIPLILVFAIIACLGWYLFIYDRDFTRDMLLHGARYCDSHGNHNAASWFYDLAYLQAGDNDVVAIELAAQHKADGNYTQAEATLARAIEDGGGVDLYVALSKTYVEQDKLLDAVKLLGGVTNPEIKAQLDAMRPSVPTVSPEPGFYNQYTTVTIEAQSGTLYVSPVAEYPSVKDCAYTEPLALNEGENTIYAVSVDDNGLVSPLGIFGYTVGGIIEEIVFEDKAIEAQVRKTLGVNEGVTLMSNDLWDIAEFIVPADAKNYNDLKHMTYLKRLTITDGVSNQLGVLTSLSDLVALNISNTPVSNDELALICALPALEELTLSDCGLSTISGFEVLTELKYLDLSNNALRNITPLASMPKLEELYLQHNALTDLTAIAGLRGLQTLDVSYNSLTSLVSVTNISTITKLEASHNSISDLNQLEQLQSLQYLGVANNTIADVNNLATVTTLTQLDISNNLITDIAELSTLVNLTKLNFANNQITAIPAFDAESALITIDGSHNLITDLEPLRGLKALNYVFMDYNEAVESVECLLECPNLIEVNVYGTAVTEVSLLTEQSIIVNFDPTLGHEDEDDDDDE